MYYSDLRIRYNCEINLNHVLFDGKMSKCSIEC